MFGWNFSTVNQDETYNLHDAIITALILNWLVRNCDTVKMAMYSTFVNITGALHVTKEGCLKRTPYYVFQMLANHTGSQLVRADVDCDSRITVHDVRRLPFGINIDKKNHVVTDKVIDQDIPAIDAVATAGVGAVYLSVVNQSLTEDCLLTLDIPGLSGKAVEKLELYSDSIRDANTADQPERVTPASSILDGGQPVPIRKHSVNVIVIPQ